MELRDKILELRELRYTYLTDLFEKLNENEVNLQPLPNKRSIGELLHHIGMVDGFPFFMAKIVQRFYLFKSVKNAQYQKLDARDYNWDLNKGKIRKAKRKSLVKLKKQFNQNLKKIKSLNYKEKDRKFRYFSEYHANFHLKQLKFLTAKSELIM
ncbi:MAG: DinB family protein [Candidatus Heimdallarchaeota archaeon]|nr:DinB family protein [Candidatus Heimdallarchaeota archaeon]